MYEFQQLKDIFDKTHDVDDNKSTLETPEDLKKLYSKIKLPSED